MARILVVDDEPNICQLIKRFAEHEGYEVEEAFDGLEAIRLCQKQEFDLIIMDIMMPDMDGFTACREIKKRSDIPVLMLSARGEEYDKLQGFEVGVDDYVVKPFSLRELMARVKVIIHRHRASQEDEMSFKEKKKCEIILNGIRIDTLGREVFVDGKKIAMTVKEYDLLLYFIENQGIALSRGQILNAVWGYEYYGDERTVDWQIKLLRNKLGKYRDDIVTLRGVGYKFETK